MRRVIEVARSLTAVFRTVKLADTGLLLAFLIVIELDRFVDVDLRIVIEEESFFDRITCRLAERAAAPVFLIVKDDDR